MGYQPYYRNILDGNGVMRTYLIADGISIRPNNGAETVGTDASGNLRFTTGAVGLFASGSAAAPSISFSGDTDTGIANTAANTLDFCTGGTSRISVTASAIALGLSINNGASLGYGWNGRSNLTSPADGVVQATNSAQTGFTRLILGTNDATANGVSIKNNGGNIETFTGDGTTARVGLLAGALSSTSTLGANGTLTLGAKTTIYNAVTTAGWGLEAIYGAATTGTVTNSGTASIATYTVGGADGVFRVSADCSVTVSTTHSFSLDVTYTDVTNTARTMVLPVNQLAGTFIASGLITNATGVGPYESAVIQIRAKAGTAITVRTSAGGTFTTVTYTASGTITQVA